MAAVPAAMLLKRVRAGKTVVAAVSAASHHASLVTALPALIQGFFSSHAIAFSIQFTLRSRCTGTLLAPTRLRSRKPLSPT